MTTTSTTTTGPAPRILCIEDDPGARDLLAEELAEAGFEVLFAVHGRQGLDAILRQRPDLIICDINLPQLSGFEILEKVKDMGSQYADIPFIFLTAYDDRQNLLHGRRLGADDYLTKPIDFELLIEIVRARLARAGGHRPPPAKVSLTGREIEALTWSARGKSSTDIAVLMGVSERTVNFHIENAAGKLGVATRIQAAVKAATLGLIKP